VTPAARVRVAIPVGAIPVRAIATRVATLVAVPVGAATVSFVALHLVPGDPVDIVLGPGSAAGAEVRARITAEYGLDRPLPVQYVQYLGRLLRGDLGESYRLQRGVAGVIGEQVGATVELAVAAVALALLGAVAAALLTAGRRGPVHGMTAAGELLAVSSPPYWIGILGLTLFSFRLGWLPVTGDDGLRSLVLPALTLALPMGGVLAQVLREGLETALGQPFAVTARARGLSDTAVRLRHALRHAALPLVTLTGWLTGSLLGGAVLVETVFGRPGIGSLSLQATTTKDIPLVSGLVLLASVVFVGLSLTVDLLYLVIDPRLRRR